MSATAMYAFVALVTLVSVAAFLLLRRRKASGDGVPCLTPKLAEAVKSAQHDGLVQAHEELGDVFRMPGKEPVFYFRNVETVSRICTDGAFVKNDAVYGSVNGVVNVSNLVQPMLDNTLFQKDGPEWKQSRKDINPLFASPEFAPVAIEYMSRFLATLGDSAECDLQEELHVVLQQATMRLMAGVEISDEAAAAYAVCIRHFSAKSTADLSESDAGLLLNLLPHALATVEEVKALGPTSTPTISRSLVGLMLKAGRYSDEEIARTLINLIVAGAESPAAGIAKTIAGAVSSTKVTQRIREELESVVEKRNLVAADVPKLKYLENVVKEGFRRWAPATIISRRVKADVDLDSVHVPAGSLVAVCVHAVHMDARVWSSPEQFVPERFETEVHPYAWIPFGGGVRGCPGKRASILLGKAVIAALLEKFDVSLGVSVEEMDQHVAKFTSWSGPGVPATLRRRVC